VVITFVGFVYVEAQIPLTNQINPKIIGKFSSNPVSTLQDSSCSLRYMDGSELSFTKGICYGAQDCYNQNIILRNDKKLTDSSGYRVYCVSLNQDEETGILYSPGIILVCRHPEWSSTNNSQMDYFDPSGGPSVYQEVNNFNKGIPFKNCDTAGYIENNPQIVKEEVIFKRDVLIIFFELVSEIRSNAENSFAFVVDNLKKIWRF